MFWVAIQSTCASRKRRGKTPRQIHNVSHYEWALKITKTQQEDPFKHYNYQEKVLNYIRALVPNNVKGDTLEVYRIGIKFC